MSRLRSSHNATDLCYFHVSWCCLRTQHKAPEPRLWVSRHRARHIFSAHNEATISLFIVWLHFIFVGLRQSQIMKSYFDHLFRCFKTEWERAHFVFIKNQRNLNCLQPLRNDLEHKDGILKFSLFAWCYTPIAKITCWNHQSDATDILAIKHFDEVKVEIEIIHIWMKIIKVSAIFKP